MVVWINIRALWMKNEAYWVWIMSRYVVYIGREIMSQGANWLWRVS